MSSKLTACDEKLVCSPNVSLLSTFFIGNPDVCAKIPPIVQVVPVDEYPPPNLSVLEKLVFSFANCVNSGIQLNSNSPPSSFDA